MRVARLGAGLLLLFGFALASADVSSEVAVPPLTARVTDLTGTLSGAAVARIEAKLKDLEAKKGSQVAVLIVPTTQPEEIEQYGIRVAEAWKLGRKGVDDGAILLVAKNDRRVRIEVGQGLEGALPDAIANRIITETITPHFKQADYEAGVNQIISVVNGELLPAPDRKWERHGGLGNLLPVLLIVVVVAGGVLRNMFGRLIGSIATGGLAGGIVWLLSHLIPIGIGAGLLAFLFAMLTGGSRSGWTNGGGFGGGLGGFGGGFGGGLGGGGRGGFGGGGGFSGGGGGVSGGGAPGRGG